MRAGTQKHNSDTSEGRRSKVVYSKLRQALNREISQKANKFQRGRRGIRR